MELIVLAVPVTGDAYYADVADKILTFHVDYAEAIASAGDRLILTDEDACKRYASALSEQATAAGFVVPHAVPDIWVRDYAPANTSSPVQFRYTAAGQGGGPRGQGDDDAVHSALAAVAEAGVGIPRSNLLNDGGTFVENFAGSAVISRTFLAYNDVEEESARAAVADATGVENVAFIDADEQGGL